MDAGHLHLLLNHVPILGTFFGLVILIIGLLRKNQTLEKAAFITFVVVAVITLPAYISGEEAEHAVEHMAGSSHDMAHEHEELAETALFMMIGLALPSLIILITTMRSRVNRAGMMKMIVLVLAAELLIPP